MKYYICDICGHVSLYGGIEWGHTQFCDECWEKVLIAMKAMNN